MAFVLQETPYEKQITELLGFLRGKGWLTAYRAVDLARRYHTGLRKDGVSPEFSHQVFLINYARTLASGMSHPEDTIAALALHDLVEDYGLTFEEIDEQFGTRIGAAVRALTKKNQGIIIPYPVYFERISLDPIASVGKAIDRAHNILTMGDTTWTLDKQEEYLSEINEWFLPMLKRARSNFPEQFDVYQNLKSVLMIEAKLIERSLSYQRNYPPSVSM